MLFVWCLVLIISLFVLIKAADYLVKYASHLGAVLGISSFIIGVTIVSIGTSIPEFITGLISVLQKEPVGDFVLSNIIGSNIANCLLVAGITALIIGTLRVKKQLIDVDIPLLFISTIVFIFFILDGRVNVAEAIILIIFFAIFITYTIKDKKRITKEDYEKFEDYKKRHKFKNKQAILWFVVRIIISIIFLYFSGKFLIQSVIEIADFLSINSALITVSIVALGTSMPEIMTSLIAAKKGEHNIAVGNIFGSCVFNVLVGTGVPALFYPISISPKMLLIAVPFLLASTLGVILAAYDNQVRSWEGGALIVLYVVFIGKLFNLF